MLRSTLPLIFALAGAAAVAQPTKVHWYGQAAFRIETPSGGVILIDPWLRVPTNPEKDSVEKLGRVDYILVAHGHWDHIGDAVEIGKKTGAVLVAPYGLQFNMKSVLGYPEAQATLATGGNVGGTIALRKAGARVTLVHAVHGSELVPPMVKPAPGGADALRHLRDPRRHAGAIQGRAGETRPRRAADRNEARRDAQLLAPLQAQSKHLIPGSEDRGLSARLRL